MLCHTGLKMLEYDGFHVCEILEMTQWHRLQAFQQLLEYMQPVPLRTCIHDSNVKAANITKQQSLLCPAVRRACVIVVTTLLPNLKRSQIVYIVCHDHNLSC